jgi:hypothetical protein
MTDFNSIDAQGAPLQASKYLRGGAGSVQDARKRSSYPRCQFYTTVHQFVLNTDMPRSIPIDPSQKHENTRNCLLRL